MLQILYLLSIRLCFTRYHAFKSFFDKVYAPYDFFFLDTHVVLLIAAWASVKNKTLDMEKGEYFSALRNESP